VLLVTAFGLIAYYAGGYPAVGVGVPLAAALFSAAEGGRLTAAIVTASAVLALSLAFRLLGGQNAAYVLGYDLVTHVTAMAMAIALGDGIRSRRAQRKHQQEVANLLARQYAQESESQAREERLAIARDLHDSIGHTVSVISLHAEVAREAAPQGYPALDTALQRIREASSATLRELRTTVGLLRSAKPTVRESVSLSDLSPVLGTARAAGFDVEERIEVRAETLPRTIDAAAYRIVQEAVTNVVRHSQASRVSVVATVDRANLRLTVTDDGPPPAGPRPRPGGHGIAGMTERATALAGSLRTRHGPTGFVVEADLPLGEDT
jgi:signal transduction histidine kinase